VRRRDLSSESSLECPRTGFVEFFDPDTASSAVRNLNGSDLDGRQLRVDHAEPDQKTMPARGGGGGGGGPAPAARSAPPSKPLLPAGIQLPPGTSAVDSISQTLATIPPAQLMEILSQMKVRRWSTRYEYRWTDIDTQGLVTQAPEKARELLNSQPQLAYALFQAMLMMKIVDGNILAQMVASNAGGGQPQQPPMQPAYQPPPQHYPQPTPAQPSYPQYAPPAPAQPAAPQPPSMANMSPVRRPCHFCARNR
jgi:cleavage stimulation factor subunit 2